MWADSWCVSVECVSTLVHVDGGSDGDVEEN